MGADGDNKGRREARELHSVRAQIRAGSDDRREGGEKDPEKGEPSGSTDRAVSRGTDHKASELAEGEEGNLSHK